jgi:hypothetical protein
MAVSLGLVTLLTTGAVLWLFQREGNVTRARIVEFHGPTLTAVHEALLAISQLRLELHP